jgi:hypothetical protein
MTAEPSKILPAQASSDITDAPPSTPRPPPVALARKEQEHKPKKKLTKEEKQEQAEKEEKDREDKLDLLRQLRVEVQGLQSLLVNIRDGQATLRTYARYIETNHVEIDALFESIRKVLPDGKVARGDNISHIHNQWQMLQCSPIIARPAEELNADDQVKELAICDRLCHEMVSEIGYLTIPASLNRWLLDGWNGYLLSFHDLFADELPRFEDRQRHLNILASVPGMIRGGIVEPITGCIFPYHDKWYKRLGICLGIALGYVGVTVGIWQLGSMRWLEIGNAGAAFGSTLVINWLLVVLGVVTHYAVARTKNSGTGATAVIPLGHPTYVVDARAGVILLKGLLMLIGFFGLLLLDKSSTPGHLDFFLVGYSLDSFAGIVSSSLDQRAATRGTELAKHLGP